MEKDTEQIMTFLREHMPTKDDVRDIAREVVREELEPFKKEVRAEFEKVHAELRDIRAELRDITARLDTLEEKVDGMRGYAKEIDELRARVSHLEKQLAAR